MPNGVITCRIGINQVREQVGMAVEDALGIVESEHHKGGGIGIGGGAVVGDDGGRKNAVLNGMARARVNRVGIALAVFHVEIAVVAAGGEGGSPPLSPQMGER